MTTGNPIADGIFAALGAFLVTWLIALFIRTMNAPISLIEREKERGDLLQKELAKLNNDYAYSLQIDAVDFEDHRQMSQDTAALMSRKGRCVLKLKNTINRPVGYSLTRLVVDGVEHKNLLSRRAVIGANSTGSFYTELFDLPLVSLDLLKIGVKTEHRIEAIIDYGPPNNPTRTMQRVMLLENFGNERMTRFRNVLDEDVPKE